MPSIRELSSIVNYGATNPAVTLSAFHANCFGGCAVSGPASCSCSCTAFSAYWSGTASTNLPGSQFTVNFTGATMGVFTKHGGFTAAVRGVRDGPQ